MTKVKTLNLILWMAIFAVAMAFLESSVVIYLRQLYYQDGFTISYRPMPKIIEVTEFFREFSTIVMMFAVAWLVGKNLKQRFAWFLFLFGTWDIFYYVWLKVMIGWPFTFTDWDILFLIPVTWLGPVLAPVICSVSMIFLALAILYRTEFRIPRMAWVLILAGAFIVYFTFTKDYTLIIIRNGFYKDLAHIASNQKFLEIIKNFEPESYAWGWFSIGEGLILLGIVLIAGWGLKKQNSV